MSNLYLKLFVDCLGKYRKLNDAEFGRLIRAALTYKATGEEVTLNGREEILWDGMKLDIDRANSAYDEAKKAKSEAGKKGAEKRWHTMAKMADAFSAMADDGKNGYIKEKEKEKEKTATVVAVENARATASADDGMPFGLSEADVDASLALDQRIEDACKQWGLPCSPGNLMQGRDMVREYSEEWLMQAIRIAGENHPTWGYVKGVLQKAKQNGSMKLPKTAKPGKTVSAQQYAQRDYTEDELMAVSGDLIAEARAKYESGVTA